MNQNSIVFHLIAVAVCCLVLLAATPAGAASSQKSRKIKKAAPKPHPLRRWDKSLIG